MARTEGVATALIRALNSGHTVRRFIKPHLKRDAVTLKIATLLPT